MPSKVYNYLFKSNFFNYRFFIDEKKKNKPLRNFTYKYNNLDNYRKFLISIIKRLVLYFSKLSYKIKLNYDLGKVVKFLMSSKFVPYVYNKKELNKNTRKIKRFFFYFYNSFTSTFCYESLEYIVKGFHKINFIKQKNKKKALIFNYSKYIMNYNHFYLKFYKSLFTLRKLIFSQKQIFYKFLKIMYFNYVKVNKKLIKFLLTLNKYSIISKEYIKYESLFDTCFNEYNDFYFKSFSNSLESYFVPSLLIRFYKKILLNFFNLPIFIFNNVFNPINNFLYKRLSFIAFYKNQYCNRSRVSITKVAMLKAMIKLSNNFLLNYGYAIIKQMKYKIKTKMKRKKKNYYNMRLRDVKIVNNLIF